MLWALPVGLIASAIVYIIYQSLLSPLASIPGPFWAKVSRLWMTKHSWDGNITFILKQSAMSNISIGDMNTTMINLHTQHGPLVRTGPNEVSVSDLAAVKKIYGAGTKFRKSEWYSVWQGHRKFDLFAERNEKLHGEQRRLVSRAYSMDALRDLEPHVNNAVKLFLENMDQRLDQIVDMGNWVQLFAFGKKSL